MEENKKKFLQGTWLNVVLGILLVVAGIVIICISVNNPADVSQFIAIVMACCLFLMGGIALVTSLVIYHGVRIHSSIIYGSAMIGVGVVLIILKDTIVTNIVTFLSVFLIAFGAAELVNSIIMTAQKKMNNVKLVWIILFYLLSAVTLALGVLVLVFNLQNNANFEKVIYTIVGICVILAGILEIVAEILKVRAKHIETKETDHKEEKQEPQETKEEAPVSQETQEEPVMESTAPVIEETREEVDQSEESKE